MSKKYAGSDWHFGHSNIIKYSPLYRNQYLNSDEMNADFITKWNSVVTSADTTYMLGDLSFLTVDETVDILNNLNGNKVLIEGNHDYKHVKIKKFKDCFLNIYRYHEMVYKDTLLVMCHYPIADHKNARRGSIMMHGHRHGAPTNIPGRIIDVGYDSTGKIVIDFDEILEKMSSIPPARY